MSGSSLGALLWAAAWPPCQGFLHQLSGKAGQMLRFKEAPAGARGGRTDRLLLSVAPDLPWNLFSLTQNRERSLLVVPANLYLHSENKPFENK